MSVAVLLRLTGEGEIFYLQERVGKCGQLFKLIKFATMLKNSSVIGTGTITVKDDPRVLPMGKFLRKSKINELPQLLNVLVGDMSLIGPRPLTVQTFQSYQADIQKIVKRVRPGLSGIGSIIFRDEENILSDSENAKQFYSNVIAPYKGDLECWFVENRSLRLYFVTIFFTIAVIVFPNRFRLSAVYRDLPEPPRELMGRV